MIIKVRTSIISLGLPVFRFSNFLILRCLNGLRSPLLCLNDYTLFVYPPSLKDREKRICSEGKENESNEHQNKR